MRLTTGPTDAGMIGCDGRVAAHARTESRLARLGALRAEAESGAYDMLYDVAVGALGGLLGAGYIWGTVRLAAVRRRWAQDRGGLLEYTSGHELRTQDGCSHRQVYWRRSSDAINPHASQRSGLAQAPDEAI